jgi:hypothetical protein
MAAAGDREATAADFRAFVVHFGSRRRTPKAPVDMLIEAVESGAARVGDEFKCEHFLFSRRRRC